MQPLASALTTFEVATSQLPVQSMLSMICTGCMDLICEGNHCRCKVTALGSKRPAPNGRRGYLWFAVRGCLQAFGARVNACVKYRNNNPTPIICWVRLQVQGDKKCCKSGIGIFHFLLTPPSRNPRLLSQFSALRHGTSPSIQMPEWTNSLRQPVGRDL